MRCINKLLLPLDEAVASRVVFVIVFGADGRGRFWGQLNNSKKTVKYRPYVSISIELAYPRPTCLQQPLKAEGRKVSLSSWRLTKMSIEHAW